MNFVIIAIINIIISVTIIIGAIVISIIFIITENNESVRFHLKTSQLFLGILSFSFFNSRFSKKKDDDYNLHIYIYCIYIIISISYEKDLFYIDSD